ncbi:MAG: aminopeptidase P family protein [Rhodothermales bacterium]
MAVLVSSLADIQWLTGFTGSNGICLVLGQESFLFTDGRYRDQAEQEVREFREIQAHRFRSVQDQPTTAAGGTPAQTGTVHVRIVSGSLIAAVGDLCRERIDLRKDVLRFQADHLTVADYDALVLALPDSRLEGVSGLLNRARALKSDDDLGALKRALALSETVFEAVLGIVKEGMTELDLAAEIDYRQKMAGASRSSFETIVASGPNSALPHARPGTTRLAPHTPVLVDFGCVLDGWCSDMTRMFCLGEPPADFLSAYTIVDQARASAVIQARAGMTSRELDAVARDVIAHAGMDDAFSHSLGHGLGTEVHEWPPVSFRSETVLPAGSVVTVEPGVYFPGRYGIRIEDTVRLGPGPAERLNRLSTELFIV